jgi:outer membrane lipoprotein-sorting protein
MKRLLTLALLTLTLFTLACATAAPKAADVSGQVTAVDGNTVTVTPAGGGSPATVTLASTTKVYFPGGAPAENSNISKGHSVNVWLVPGSQTASRVNIGY